MSRPPIDVPEPLRAGAAAVLAVLDGTPALAPERREQWLRVAACSGYAAGTLVRHAGFFAGLPADEPFVQPATDGEIARRVAAAAPAGIPEADFCRQLRLVRHRELLRILWREVNGAATVPESLRDLSALADSAINAALAWARQSLGERHGTPRLEDGTACGLGILGMGKLGGQELNFSSDVDLVFVFSDTGVTSGPRVVSNEEYFRALGQKLVALLGQQTAEGFVYRVDVRLRPFGASGPLAVSLPGLENYLMQHGRDWERYAYVKARVVNDWIDADYFYRDVVRPFVYRRYLDYGVFASLRDMKAMIEAEVQRREYQDNVKLGPGGIREIEFIVQSFQLVRGGSIADLRGREILRVLPALARHGCLSTQAVAELTQAYLFLRRVENAIQALQDQQTHMIPTDPLDRARVALALGFSSWEPVEAELGRHRETVSRHFQDVVFRGEAPSGKPAVSRLRAVWQEETTREAAVELLREAGFGDPPAVLERLRQLRAAGPLQRLDEIGRQRLDALVPAVLEIAAGQRDPLLALQGVAQVIEAIGRRSAYFALLNENPAARERLVGLCATSDFLARQVAAHPLLLDELLDQRLFSAAPTREELAEELERRMSGVDREDQERWLEALRNFQQAAMFRVAVADLSGVLPLMKVSDRLTEIAEMVLDRAADQAWHELATRHGQPRCVVEGVARHARFGIVAYGKLGGLELGYGSDLDLVFLHDSTGEAQHTDGERPLENAVFFARLARRIITIATTITPAGQLYEVDTRLQPEGRKGLLVSSLAAFEAYQRDGAWTWEHQALLRSRAIAGSPAVREAFEDVRRRILTGHVRRDALRTDVLAMRERMLGELAKGTPQAFHIKHDPGGITDIEFIVQYLVLREAYRHPELVRWSDNIRQLEALAAAGVITAATAAMLTDTYRVCRQRLHRLALAGQPAFMPREEAADSIAAVRATWDEVFGTAPAAGAPG
ncbi:MAG: bifunctional [glutamate--ammonia ligase]-adenylyl-L-tyrosine phosphorylase/[glutamate--ammonia-ligase] adenylyltransferase [Gammaproteobacteria bacterium]|nr:bifunctional [glutamate--ammonia ligase]-adenylyl-L-tyrosine phosphorylase/[glutamate--ammonia-ligase] adenylyltransferase [Gammaproteobacteria bacterium]